MKDKTKPKKGLTWDELRKKYDGKKPRLSTVIHEAGFKMGHAKKEVPFSISISDMESAESCSMNNCAGVKALHRIYDKKILWCIIGSKYAYIVWRRTPGTAYRYIVPTRFYTWKLKFDNLADCRMSNGTKRELKRLLAEDMKTGDADFDLLTPSRSHRLDYNKKYEKRSKSRSSGKHTTVQFEAYKGCGDLRGKRKSYKHLRVITYVPAGAA